MPSRQKKKTGLCILEESRGRKVVRFGQRLLEKEGMQMGSPKCVAEWKGRENGSYRLMKLEKNMYREGRLKNKYRRSKGMSREDFRSKLLQDLACKA